MDLNYETLVFNLILKQNSYTDRVCNPTLEREKLLQTLEKPFLPVCDAVEKAGDILYFSYFLQIP